ncbi:hypothetical protein ACHHYP_12901 [Achlya hypogyna]|uniref:60S ribosomal protein L4 n=1 Tax=Achlya hypogyna TaxID=1202772 RepID=A0A1V9ZG69_ACHHY|nr:hypothetical protein ACHHYP_12901 [Achlya hypogyna]
MEAPKKHHVSVEDIQHTLHAHFHAAKKDDKAKYVRKHVVTFVQVKKLKTMASKRMFGSFGNSKCKLLCLTTHETLDTKVVGQLHYVNFQANYTIDCRKTWSLDDLVAIENCLDDMADHPRGSFRLKFHEPKEASEPLQWVVHPSESATAMKEFIWALSALYADTKLAAQGSLAESTFSVQELTDFASEARLQAKFGLDVDLAALQHLGTPEHPDRRRSWDPAAPAVPVSPASSDTTPASLKSAEYDDALALFATIDWTEASVEDVATGWTARLAALEADNMEFLLAFQGKKDEQKAMDPLLGAVDGVLREVKMAEKWTEDADATLGTTAANMSQFEALNSQMEVHFKNSVALESALRAMIEAVDVPRELLGPLLKPVALFQSAADAAPLVPAVRRLDAAIKSVENFPANHMMAFKARKDELAALGAGFSEKLAAALDQFLQQRVKAWTMDQAQSRCRSVSSGSDAPKKSGLSTFGRDRDVSSLTAKDDKLRRPSATATEDADWGFSNETLHRELGEYQELCSSVSVLSGRATSHLRDIYVKHIAQIYGPHVQTVFRSLKDMVGDAAGVRAYGALPKAKTSLPGKASSWSISLSFSHAPDLPVVTPSQLLRQGLQHVLPLCQSEQAFVRGMFFQHEAGRKAKSEPPELTSMMEALFEKFLKRLVDFAEAGVHVNVMEALGMVVVAQQQLAALETKSDFVTNVLLSFQLHLKRVFSKYIEDQEAWLANMHPDTRLVGVLRPVQKMMGLIGRLESAGGGSHDEALLAPIYERLVSGLFAWLEKAAATKPKYSHLVRLENYHYMHDQLTALSLHGGHSAVVLTSTEVVFAEYSKNLNAYAEWLWRCEAEKFIAAFEAIEKLLETVPEQEVQFHVSKHDVRKAMDVNTQHLDKAIKHIGDRLKKHLSHSPAMIGVVAQSLQALVLTQREHFATIAMACYGMELEPTAARLTALLAKLQHELSTMAAARPVVSVLSVAEDATKVVSQIALPAVLTAPIRPDVVTFVHTNMNKNNRQAYAVSRKAGHQHSAESWGTGRAVARIPRISGGGTQRAGQGAFGNMCRSGRMFAPTRIWRKWHRKINVNQRRFAVASALAASAVPSLVLARGHRIEQVSEIPLVLDDSVESTQKTSAAVKILAKIGAAADVEKVKDSKKIRTGRGKSRNRRYSLKKGPLFVYAHANGIEKAFRNIPGVELVPVERLNLLSLAPGGHVGRFIVWTKSAFEQLDTIYGTYTKKSAVKSNYTLPRHVMTNANLGRLINSDEIQSVVRAGIYKNTRRAHKKNPLKNLGAMVKLNPYTLVARRAELRAEALRKEKKGAIVAAKRQIKTTKNDPKRKAQSKALFAKNASD